MKIYISGKITGDENWKEKFNNAEKVLIEKFKDCVIFNPILTAKYENKISWEDFLIVDFAFIDISDAIYMLSDWKDSKGANREFEYAKSKGKKIIFENVNDLEVYMEEQKKEDKVILNGKEMTKNEFEEEKKKLEEKKVKIVETSPNNYITRLLD